MPHALSMLAPVAGGGNRLRLSKATHLTCPVAPDTQPGLSPPSLPLFPHTSPSQRVKCWIPKAPQPWPSKPQGGHPLRLQGGPAEPTLPDTTLPPAAHSYRTGAAACAYMGTVAALVKIGKLEGWNMFTEPRV